MAGPTSSILVDTALPEQLWGELVQVIQSISNKMDGNNFIVVNTEPIKGTVSTEIGRPFEIEKHKIDSDYCEYTEDEIIAIKNYVGFNPVYNLVIYAMCNGEIDHRILGEITLYLAEKFNGLIDFGGHLTKQSTNIKGKIWEIPYETSESTTATYHVANVDFMKDWLRNPNFRMIK